MMTLDVNCLLVKMFEIKNDQKVIYIGNQSIFICQLDLTDRNTLVFQDNWGRYILPRSTINWIDNSYMNKAGLKTGKATLPTNEIRKEYYKEGMDNFKKRIIKMHRDVLFSYLGEIVEFLKNRKTEKGLIIHHDHIQLMLGEIIAHLRHVDNMLMRNQPLLLVQRELKSAGELLAILGGGRSFLQGGIIEIMVVFDLVYNIYLDD